MVIPISPEKGNDDERDESTRLRRCLTRLSLGNGITTGRSPFLASSDEAAMSPPADSSSPIAGRFLGNPDKLNNNSTSPAPPPLSIAIKRRRFFTSVVEEDAEMDCEQNRDAMLVKKKMLVRKLGDEFDRIASEDTSEMIRNLDLNSERDLNKISSERENVQGAEAQERLKPGRVSRSSPSSPASRKRICSPRLAMMHR